MYICVIDTHTLTSRVHLLGRRSLYAVLYRYDHIHAFLQASLARYESRFLIFVASRLSTKFAGIDGGFISILKGDVSPSSSAAPMATLAWAIFLVEALLPAPCLFVPFFGAILFSSCLLCYGKGRERGNNSCEPCMHATTSDSNDMGYGKQTNIYIYIYTYIYIHIYTYIYIYMYIWVDMGWVGSGWLGWTGLGWGSVGLRWVGLGWFELGWAGLGLGWAALGWAGLVWAGLGWSGLGWVGLYWVGLGWAGLGWVGSKMNPKMIEFYYFTRILVKY